MWFGFQNIEEGCLQAITSGTGVNSTWFGKTKRMRDRSRSFDDRPCSYIDIHSTQICSGSGSWVHQGESAIQIARQFCGKKRNYNGEKFGARGYFASTVGKLFEYISSHQEKEDQYYEQINLFD
jgi:putative transposase